MTILDWETKFDEVVELHINGIDTRKQFSDDAKVFILDLLKNQQEKIIEKLKISWDKHIDNGQEIWDLGDALKVFKDISIN